MHKNALLLKQFFIPTLFVTTHNIQNDTFCNHKTGLNEIIMISIIVGFLTMIIWLLDYTIQLHWILFADTVRYGLSGRPLKLNCELYLSVGWRGVISGSLQQIQNSERIVSTVLFLTITRFVVSDEGFYWCYAPAFESWCTKVNSYGMLHTSSTGTYNNQYLLLYGLLIFLITTIETLSYTSIAQLIGFWYPCEWVIHTARYLIILSLF